MTTRQPLPMSGGFERKPVSDSPLTTHHSPLIDSFGRRHNNLRISVTDRCNLRCTYCMPEDVVFLDRSELLSFEEITRFRPRRGGAGHRQAAADRRRTADAQGPAQARRACSPSVPGIRDVGLTTNGILLAEQAEVLFDAGLRRLNVIAGYARPRPLPRTDPARRPGAGARRARRPPSEPGSRRSRSTPSPSAASPSTMWCRWRGIAAEHGFEMRFIEYMPIGAEAWEREKVFFAHEILELIGREVGELVPGECRPDGTGHGLPTTATAAGMSGSSPPCRGRSATSATGCD